MVEIGDKTLKAGLLRHGGIIFEAKYIIQGESLHYTLTSVKYDPEAYSDSKDINYSDDKGEKGICKIVKVNDSLFFQERLKCSGPIGKYIDDSNNKTSKVFRTFLSEGTPRKIHGIETLSVLKGGTVNDAAYLRSAPDAASKPLTCTIWKPYDSGKEYEGPVIPKGRELFIISKTKTKVKVQKWENYWYYVDGIGPGISCGPGWVYGEFITIK